MQYEDLSSMNDALSSIYEYKKDVHDCGTMDGEEVSDFTTASLSSVPSLNSISEWASGEEQKRLNFIEQDCLARLKDVRETNEKAKSLSAFMSILALIGMLAKFAFSKNQSLKDKHIDGCGGDQKEYQAFCDCYLLGDNDYEQKLNCEGLSYLLYKYVRCGLLHGGTLTNTRATTKQINATVYLTHRGTSYKSLEEINEEIKKASASNHVEVILDAFFLCDELKKAIGQMFSDSRQEIKNSILETFEVEPPILCVTGNKQLEKELP